MCNEKSHSSLQQTAHFTRHAMVVEQVRSIEESGSRKLPSWAGVIDACEALDLIDDGLPKECVEQLGKFVLQHIPEEARAS